MKTNTGGVDDVLGGLAYGMHIFYGKPGTGKSKMAKTIAGSLAEQGKKILYVYGEDSFDAPDPRSNKNINTLDLLSWKPSPELATKYIFKSLEELQPELLVLDSLTTILGATTKAVPEADVREWTSKLALHTSGKIPVIAVSETRKYDEPAGGMGVLFPAIMLCFFSKKTVDAKWDVDRYGGDIGETAYLMNVQKDRDGVANQGKEHIVTYMAGLPLFS